MADIFDNQILCKKCGRVMKSGIINKNGFNLRAVKCERCSEILIHPVDKAEYENFIRLKDKEFNVKMRMVGNSYAVSIPREIVDFMHEQEKMMNDMVRLSFEDAGRVSLMFNAPETEDSDENENKGVRSRFVSSKEVRIVKDGKPVLHARKFYDSANPKNNKTIVLKRNNQGSKHQEEEIE